MKRRRRHNFGFTLIELVLALAMVVIVAYSLYESLRVGLDAPTKTNAILEPSRTADLAMQLISNDLQNSVMPAISTANFSSGSFTNAGNITDLIDTSNSGSLTLGANTSTVPGSASSTSSTSNSTLDCLAGPFEGTQGTATGTEEVDDLIFFTNADSPQHPDANGETKLVELTIAVPPGSTDKCLVRRVTANLLQTGQTVGTDTQIICRGVSSLTFQYFDGTTWYPSWDSTQADNDLPQAVQVTLGFERPGPNGTTKIVTYTRTFMVPCSNVALDPNYSPPS